MACSGWDSDEAPDAQAAATSASNSSRRRSRTPPLQRQQASPPLAAEVLFPPSVPEDSSVSFWQTPLSSALEDYRLQRLEQGLQRPIVHDSLCTGMGTDMLAHKVGGNI